MVDVTPPNLLNFSIPTEVDLSNLGGSNVTFQVTATDEQGGSGIREVIITLDRFMSVGNGAHRSSVVAGESSVDGQLISSDTFTDATPTTADVTYSVGPGTPSGVVTVESIWVLDNANHVTIYDTAELSALGLNTKVTLINPLAPIAPTAAIVTGVDAGSTPTFAGASPAGSTVYLTAFFDGEWINLGSAVAGIDGKWSLQSKQLADGTYVDATAWEVDSHGNASALSTSFSFDVWSSGIATPSAVVPEDVQGKVHTANPVVTGTAAASAEITLFADGNKIGTGHADNNGHWAILSNDLSNGAHSITATQTTTAGTTSAASMASNVVVDIQPNIGLHFAVASATGPNGAAVDAGYIQKMLNDIGARLNEFIDTNQTLSVKVSVDSLKDGAVASAAASWLGVGANGPTLTNGVLNLSVDDVGLYSTAGQANPYLFAHETLHALGINDAIPAFANLVHSQDGIAYFYGTNATAINGGPVRLDSSLSHLYDATDLMGSSGGSLDSASFGASNPLAPYSTLDIAILKDLGWKIKPTLVSTDGHTFVAGSGKPGFDHVTGTAGLDTLIAQGNHSEFTGSWTSGKYVLTDTRDGTSQTLDSVERIQFSDTMIGLDVNGVGGEIYRLYEAVFGRTPDAAGLGYWIKQGDNGMALREAAALFVTSNEFKTLYDAAPTSDTILRELYANVLHRAPDQAGFDYWKPIIEKSPGNLADVLVGFSESAENQQQVAKIIGNGFEYHPYA